MSRCGVVLIVLSEAVFTLPFSPTGVTAQLVRGYGLTVGGVRAEQQWEYSPAAFNESGSTPGVPSSRIWGVDVGAFVEFFDAPHISVLTELRYVQKGRTVTLIETVPANNPQGYIDLGPRDYAQRSHFIVAAIMPKLRLEYETLTPFIAFGPSLDILVSYPSTNITLKRYELAVSVALGAEMSVASSLRILAQLRYNPTLTDAYSTDRLAVRNRAMEILLGLAF